MKGIIGAICGDIIGSTYEFHPIKTKDFEIINKHSRFTDDTVLTLAVASWLTEDKTHNTQTLVKKVQKLANKYPHAGYGGRFSEWTTQENPEPYNSWGNGSAMRVSPVAWVCDTLEETQMLAAKSASITHNHPEGIKGAVATATAIYLARNKKSKEFIKKYIETTYNYDLSRKLKDIRKNYKFEVSCQKSVPESIICFLEADSYVDTIRNAISMGGDADTMAAISGSIAAAYYDVPQELINKCEEKLDDYLTSILEEYQQEYLHSNKAFSNIKGDIPFEYIEFDNGMKVLIEYVTDKSSPVNNYNGKYTCKYRRIQLLGPDGMESEIFEENPDYNSKADKLNDKWQKNNAYEDFNNYSLEIIHEGLSLKEIKQRILDDKGYLVVLWKKDTPPLPVELGKYKDSTLNYIDRSNTLTELTLNVLYENNF